MLTNQQLKQLHKAVLRTFNRRELDTLLYSQLGRKTHNTYAKNDFSGFTFDLINDADMQGWMDELLNALHNERPQEPVFRELAGISPSVHLPTQHKKSKQPILLTAKFLLPVIILLIAVVLPFILMSTTQMASPTVVEVTVVVDMPTVMATLPPPTISQDSLPTIITWNSAQFDADFEELILEGEAPYGASIRLLLDDKEIEDVEQFPENEWRATTTVPSSGTHTIKVELLDDDGQVIERFQRYLEVPERP